MLTSGSSLERRLEVVDAGVARGRARPRPAGRSARSGPGRPACRPRRPTAWPPRRRRRRRSRASASGRGPAGTWTTARARSVTLRTRSQSCEPSNSGSKPPTSSTSERRRTLRWQVYIWVRIRSGDQSGLKNGRGVVAGGGRSCPRRCRRSRPRGRVERLVDAARARRGGAGRRGRAGRRTRRRAIASASLEAATMPPFSLAVLRPGCAGRRRCARLEHLARRGAARSRRRRGRAPSRRSVWRRTESQHRAEHVGRRVVDRREDREARRRPRYGLRAASRRSDRAGQPRRCPAAAARPSCRRRSTAADVRFELGQLAAAPAPSSASLPISRSRSRWTSCLARAASSAPEPPSSLCLERVSLARPSTGECSRRATSRSSAMRGASRLKIQTPKAQTPTKIATAGSRCERAAGGLGPRSGRCGFGEDPDPDLLEDHRQRVDHQQVFVASGFEGGRPDRGSASRRRAPGRRRPR